MTVCAVCKHPARVVIDTALVDRSISQKDLAKKHSLPLRTVERHMQKHVRGNSPQALAIQRALPIVAHGAVIGGQITALVREASKDRSMALERGDYRLALKAIDTLLKAHELQARLTLEAREGTAHDVASNLEFQALAADIMRALAPWPEAGLAVSRMIKARLGLALPIDVL